MALSAAEIGEQVHLAERAVAAAEDRIPEGEDLTVALLKALMHRADAYGEDASAAVRQAQLLFERERI